MSFKRYVPNCVLFLLQGGFSGLPALFFKTSHFSVEITLSTRACFCFDPHIFIQYTALLHHDALLNLAFCNDGFALLFSSEEVAAPLPVAQLLVLKSPFSVRQAQFVQVFLMKPPPFCKLSTGFLSTNESVTSFLRLLSVFSVFSLPFFFFFTLSGTHMRNFPAPSLSFSKIAEGQKSFISRWSQSNLKNYLSKSIFTSSKNTGLKSGR